MKEDNPSNLKFFTRGLIIGAVILIIGYILYLVITRSGISFKSLPKVISPAISDEFKTNADGFLQEGEKLSIMIEQGVNYGDFKNQLIEVKLAYSLVEDSWPETLITNKNEFDHTIQGWDLTLQIWQYGLESNLSMNSNYLLEDSILLRDASAYIGKPKDETMFLPLDDWVGVLLNETINNFRSSRSNYQNAVQ